MVNKQLLEEIADLKKEIEECHKMGIVHTCFIDNNEEWSGIPGTLKSVQLFPSLSEDENGDDCYLNLIQ